MAQLSDLSGPVDQLYEDVRSLAMKNPDHLVREHKADAFNAILDEVKKLLPNNPIIQKLTQIKVDKLTLDDFLVVIGQLKAVLPDHGPEYAHG